MEHTSLERWVYLDSGNVIECITGDAKAIEDTDAERMLHTKDGSAVEFIVDASRLNKDIKKTGNVGALDKFSGSIIKVVVYSNKLEIN